MTTKTRVLSWETLSGTIDSASADAWYNRVLAEARDLLSPLTLVSGTAGAPAYKTAPVPSLFSAWPTSSDTAIAIPAVDYFRIDCPDGSPFYLGVQYDIHRLGWNGSNSRVVLSLRFQLSTAITSSGLVLPVTMTASVTSPNGSVGYAPVANQMAYLSILPGSVMIAVGSTSTVNTYPVQTNVLHAERHRDRDGNLLTGGDAAVSALGIVSFSGSNPTWGNEEALLYYAGNSHGRRWNSSVTPPAVSAAATPFGAPRFVDGPDGTTATATGVRGLTNEYTVFPPTYWGPSGVTYGNSLVGVGAGAISNGVLTLPHATGGGSGPYRRFTSNFTPAHLNVSGIVPMFRWE